MNASREKVPIVQNYTSDLIVNTLSFKDSIVSGISSLDVESVNFLLNVSEILLIQSVQVAPLTINSKFTNDSTLERLKKFLLTSG